MLRDAVPAAACLAAAALHLAAYLGALEMDPLVELALTVPAMGWLAVRASEEMVEGLRGISESVGISPYVAGVLGSLASNTPDVLITLFAALSGSEEMVEVAVLSSMMGVGFSIGLVATSVLAAWATAGGRAVEVPREALTDELNALAFTLTAYLALSVASVARLLGGRESHLPVGTGLLLIGAYLSYLAASLSRQRLRGEGEKGAALRHLVRVGLSVALVVAAAHMMVSSTERVVEGGGLTLVQASAVLAFVGVVPEHSSAVVAALRGEVDVAMGTSLGSVTQTALLVVGVLASVVPLPLDDYVVAQMGVTAASALLLKFFVRDDGRVDVGESAMLILLQALAFELMLT